MQSITLILFIIVICVTAKTRGASLWRWSLLAGAVFLIVDTIISFLMIVVVTRSGFQFDSDAEWIFMVFPEKVVVFFLLFFVFRLQLDKRAARSITDPPEGFSIA